MGHSDLSNHSYFLIINMKKMDLVEFIDYHFSCRKIAVLQNRIQQGVTNYETRHPDLCSLFFICIEVFRSADLRSASFPRDA
jgi:hypothetical protein